MEQKLIRAVMREAPAKATTPEASPIPGLESVSVFSSALAATAVPERTTALPEATPPPPYGLDPTGDFDLSALTSEHVLALEQQLTEDPERVLASAEEFYDSKLTEAELRSTLEKARVYLEQPTQAVAVLESIQMLESTVTMPPSWGFEGYDPSERPISPMDTKFETAADWDGYAFAWLGANVANSFKPKPPFPRHTAERTFVYDFTDKETKIGVLSDFGNGLAHSHYIAKHLRASQLDHLLYLGDVYYTGNSKEFASYVGPEIEPFLTGEIAGGAKVNVMMLNSNHEMYTKGHSYFSYLKYRLAKGAPQCQEGSYFALRFGASFQIIAVDTDYDGHLKFRDPQQIVWLKQRLAEGRKNGAVNILLTANEAFEYGKKSTTRLYDDMEEFLPSVDLWLWGNTHYCGLFDHTATLPVSSCLGHGGYPYKLHENKLDKDLYHAPCPARPRFLEARPRYDGTSLRPDVGNNGYAIMHLEPGDGVKQPRVRMEYWDWMKRLRYRAILSRDESGRFAVIEGHET